MHLVFLFGGFMSILYLTILTLSIVPIYIGWALLLLFLAISTISVPIFLSIFFIRHTLLQAISVGSEIQNADWQSDAENIFDLLLPNLKKVDPTRVCACVGKIGTNYKVVVHIAGSKASGSWVEVAESPIHAVRKLEAKHKSRGYPIAPGCQHNCPLAGQCPNRNKTSKFVEFYRREYQIAA